MVAAATAAGCCLQQHSAAIPAHLQLSCTCQHTVRRHLLSCTAMLMPAHCCSLRTVAAAAAAVVYTATPVASSTDHHRVQPGPKGRPQYHPGALLLLLAASDADAAGHGCAHESEEQQDEHHGSWVQISTKKVHQLLHGWLLLVGGVPLTRGCAAALPCAALTAVTCVHFCCCSCCYKEDRHLCSSKWEERHIQRQAGTVELYPPSALPAGSRRWATHRSTTPNTYAD